MPRIGDWLAAQTPAPPAVLMERIQAISGTATFETPAELARTLNGLALDLLQGVGADRSAATDLLAADALVSYAMEAAADDPAALKAFAASSAQRISMIASRGGDS